VTDANSGRRVVFAVPMKHALQGVLFLGVWIQLTCLLRAE
jgi:hypothetical protein